MWQWVGFHILSKRRPKCVESPPTCCGRPRKHYRTVFAGPFYAKVSTILVSVFQKSSVWCVTHAWSAEVGKPCCSHFFLFLLSQSFKISPTMADTYPDTRWCCALGTNTPTHNGPGNWSQQRYLRFIALFPPECIKKKHRRYGKIC